MHIQTIYQLWSRPGTLPAIVLQTSCKIVTPWQKVRGNVIPLVGFGDLQPLFVLAKVKFIWRVARKDRWNTGSQSHHQLLGSYCSLRFRATPQRSSSYFTFFWEGCSPFICPTVTKCKFQTSRSSVMIQGSFLLVSNSVQCVASLQGPDLLASCESVLRSLSDCLGFVERYCIY